MNRKSTAHRPSQSNQQYVLNSQGEKVLNTAFVDSKNNHNINDIQKHKEDFDSEENISDLVKFINGSNKPAKPITRDLYIDDILDPDILDSYVNNGLINARRHLEYPLTIYKYSDELMYSQQWDNVTLQCRGLIVEDTGKIIARGYNKFFNLSEMPRFDISVSPNDNCVIMPKEDGSLGIIYKYDGKYHISTAGSFDSEQARHATSKLNNMNLNIPKGYNPIVEIIYPENRIVTDYGDRDDLILLGATNNYGHWMHPSILQDYWNGTVVDTKKGTVRDMLNAKDPKDTREGFVARLDNGLMVKMKYPHYLTLHRMKYSLSYKAVLESITNGSYDEYRLSIPDEFVNNFNEYKAKIDKRVDNITQEIDKIAARVPDTYDRKEKAIWVNNNVPREYRGYIMNLKVVGRKREDVLKEIYKDKRVIKENY